MLTVALVVAPSPWVEPLPAVPFVLEVPLLPRVEPMPHCHSPEKRRRRHLRAVERGYVRPRPSGCSHVAVPSALQDRVRSMTKSLDLHARHDHVAGRSSHFARAATLAAEAVGGITASEKNDALRIHQAANKAKHAALGPCRRRVGAAPVPADEADDLEVARVHPGPLPSLVPEGRAVSPVFRSRFDPPRRRVWADLHDDAEEVADGDACPPGTDDHEAPVCLPAAASPEVPRLRPEAVEFVPASPPCAPTLFDVSSQPADKYVYTPADQLVPVLGLLAAAINHLAAVLPVWPASSCQAMGSLADKSLATDNVNLPADLPLASDFLNTTAQSPEAANGAFEPSSSVMSADAVVPLTLLEEDLDFLMLFPWCTFRLAMYAFTDPSRLPRRPLDAPVVLAPHVERRITDIELMVDDLLREMDSLRSVPPPVAPVAPPSPSALPVDLQEDLDTIYEEIQLLKVRNLSHTEAAKALDDRVAALEALSGALPTIQVDLDTHIKNLMLSIHSTLSPLEGRVVALEAHPGSGHLEKLLDDVRMDLTALDARVPSATQPIVDVPPALREDVDALFLALDAIRADLADRARRSDLETLPSLLNAHLAGVMPGISSMVDNVRSSISSQIASLTATFDVLGDRLAALEAHPTLAVPAAPDRPRDRHHPPEPRVRAAKRS